MFPWDVSAEPDTDLAAQLRATSLGKLVRNDVLGMILRGEIKAGERINEPDVASRLGVSRVPVREALRELESSGLVEARKHSGVFVRKLGEVEVRGLYELRALLDGFAGRRCAALPEAQRTVLAEALDASVGRMEQAARARNVSAYYSENLRFHWVMVEACGNGPLADSYRNIVQKLHLSRVANLSQGLAMFAVPPALTLLHTWVPVSPMPVKQDVLSSSTVGGPPNSLTLIAFFRAPSSRSA